MKVTYFTNAAKEMSFERNTLEECIDEYRKRRHSAAGANWGRLYINGNRIWL
jgi:hypothetical protein